MKRFLIIPLLIPFLLLSCTETRTVWLDELDLTLADQATGVTRANQSMWRTPLVIATDTFARGVGTHAFGMMRVALDGRARSFDARVGVDDSAPAGELAQASVEFVVVGDGRVLWRSGVMRGGDEARQLKVSLRGVKSLILRTDHAGDGLTGDRADWVDARFEVAGDDPRMVRRTQEEAYILTPDEPARPHINSPYRHGVRPGNPVLFTIPVSGERPMTVRVDNLPAGLQVDAATGILTGRVARPGTYALHVTAENAHGTATGTLTLEVGDTLALTPPMGWSSWNVFGEDIDDAKIRAMADALVEHGLNRYGYTYINIDDGWQGVRGGKYNAIMPNEKFPDMKALVDYVHGKGLKIGIYSSPWVETFAGFIGGSADTPDGRVINSSRRMGQYSFIENDVRQWAEWGFDYLKYDWTTNDVPHATAMRDALRASGRDIVYSMANAAPFDLAADWQRLTNLRRTTGDIIDTWCSMATIGFTQDKWQPYACPGSWNDPDMMVLGHVGWGDGLHPTRLSPDEQYTHVSLWSLLAAPLILGCDMRLLDDFTLSLLKNREVIAVNQDVAGIQGHRVYRDNDRLVEVWARPLHDGSVAVGLFNLGEEVQSVDVDWHALGLEGDRQVRDLWRQQDLGVFDGQFSASVPAHGVVLVKIFVETSLCGVSYPVASRTQDGGVSK